MKDRTLFPLPPATAGLTDRQTIILELLQQHPDGLRAIDLGRHLHIERGCPTCTPNRTCQYATRDANQVLATMGTSTRQLVIRRRSGLWEALVGVQDGRYDPARAEWPAGF